MRIPLLVGVFVCIAGADWRDDEDADDFVVEKEVFVGQKFDFDEMGTISVPVKVFGQDCQFGLQTGSFLTFFHPDFRDQLGPKVEGPAQTMSSGNATVELFAHPEMEIGLRSPELFRSKLPAACAKTDPGRSDAWRNYKGVLGMSYLGTKVLHINFDESIAEFIESSSNVKCHKERIRRIESIPYIPMRVSDDAMLDFTINSGGISNVDLSFEVFDKYHRKGKIRLKPSEAVSAPDRTPMTRNGILDLLDLGPYRFANVSVREGKRNILGRGILSRFDLILDFPNRIAKFEPWNRIDDPDRRDRSGFHVRRVSGRTLIVETQLDGAGWKAEIRDNDDLVSIDEIPAETLPILKIIDRLCEPGAERKLVLRRDGVERNVNLQLENDPDPFPNECVRRLDPIEDF